MFKTTLFKIKQAKCQQWKNRQANCGIFIQYYSAIKRNIVWKYATTWTNLENIVLSKRNQTQKSHIV